MTNTVKIYQWVRGKGGEWEPEPYDGDKYLLINTEKLLPPHNPKHSAEPENADSSERPERGQYGN